MYSVLTFPWGGAGGARATAVSRRGRFSCSVQVPSWNTWFVFCGHRWIGIAELKKGEPWCEAGWGIAKQPLTCPIMPVEQKRKPSLFAILIKWHLRGLSCWLLTLLHIAPFQDECSVRCLLYDSFIPCKIDCTSLPEMGFPESWAHISWSWLTVGLLRL